MEEEQNMPKKKEETETFEESQQTPQESPETPATDPTPVSDPAPPSERSPEQERGTGPEPAQEQEIIPENPGFPLPDSPKHPALLPPTLQFPPGRMALVENNAIVRKIGAILANGSRFSQNMRVNFNAHQGLMIQMRNAFEARTQDVTKAEQDFLTTLETYLTQAHGKIPHTIPPQDIEASIQHTRALIAQINAKGRTDGFEQVARYLLLLANAPLAHF
jgi:hypothetical protein